MPLSTLAKSLGRRQKDGGLSDLLDVQDGFLPLAGDYHISSYIEMVKSPGKGKITVSKTGATPGYYNSTDEPPIPMLGKNHAGLCQFETDSDNDFRDMCRKIKRPRKARASEKATAETAMPAELDFQQVAATWPPWEERNPGEISVHVKGNPAAVVQANVVEMDAGDAKGARPVSIRQDDEEVVRREWPANEKPVKEKPAKLWRLRDR